MGSPLATVSTGQPTDGTSIGMKILWTFLILLFFLCCYYLIRWLWRSTLPREAQNGIGTTGPEPRRAAAPIAVARANPIVRPLSSPNRLQTFAGWTKKALSHWGISFPSSTDPVELELGIIGERAQAAAEVPRGGIAPANVAPRNTGLLAQPPVAMTHESRTAPDLSISATTHIPARPAPD